MSGYEIDWAGLADRLGTVARDDAGWYAAQAAALVRPADRVVVDLGCGGGGMAIALAAAAPAGAGVVAVDGDEAVLAGARANAAAAGVAVRFGRADVAGEPAALRAAGVAVRFGRADVAGEPASLRAAGVAVRFVRADIAGEPAALRAAIGAPADLIWASAVLHHAPDQQAALTDVAGLLAPGGRLALAEGGRRAEHLPWDLGVGEPGLELRLDAAQDRWFAGMRAALPGAVPMPYGWTEALRRAGLVGVTTRSTLIERPVPLADADRAAVVDGLRWRVDLVRGSGLLDAADDRTWARLLDQADPAFLGHRADLYHLDARSVHIGHSPAGAGNGR